MTKGKPATRRVAIGLAVAGGVGGALLGAAFLFRDPLVSGFAARALLKEGLVCDPVAVHLPASLRPSTVELAPMRCTSAEGPLASIRFVAPLEVEIDGSEARAVSCADIDINLRVQHRRVTMNGLGDLSRVVGLDQPAVDLLLDWTALAPRDVPPLSVARVLVRRSGERVVEMRNMRLWMENGGQSMSAVKVHVDKVAALGDATLSGHSAPVKTVMNLVFGKHLGVQVTGTQLRAPRPNVDFKVDFSPEGG
jgi:hypothetical protein